MFISLVGTCLIRIVWIYTVFDYFRRLDVLYYSYPVTWIITSLAFFLFCFAHIKRVEKRKGAA